MEQEKTPSPTPLEAGRRYEVGDVRPSWVAIAVGGFVLLAIVIHAILWVVLNSDARRAQQTDVPRSVLTDHVPTHGAPVLQPTELNDVTPEQDLEALKRREDQVFKNLGWKVDPATHHAQPPD